ncbi:glycosyltransferase family 2 protein [Bradyrhizobium elkanii]|uniref:glycosyltransferase family 2 protein n=1 Tax=Bradyrhizobium elkanii TaxID=29448 RepID=UPI003D254C46
MPFRNQKIAILLATFNGAAHIKEQLESFAAQSHNDWELVVSDDGSTDRTLAIVQEFAHSVPQRIELTDGPQKGFWRNFVSLTKRAESSDAELFAFSDQDDIWFPDKLGRAAKWFATGSSDIPRLYFTRTELIDEDGRLVGLSPLFRRKPSFQNALVQNMGGGNTMVMNKAAKRLLAQAPDDIALISHDWWAYQVVTGSGGVAFYDPLPSLKYRQHRNNLIGANRGFWQRYLRATAFANRRMKHWNEVNIATLNKMRYSFTPPTLSTLDDFAAARRSTLSKRIYLLSRSGVYRQGILETVGLYLGAMLGLI